jgi:hypothetical protein
VAKGRKIPSPPTISSFKAALAVPLKSCHPFSLRLSVALRSREITVIQMLSDFLSPVNIREESIAPSFTMQHTKKEEWMQNETMLF